MDPMSGCETRLVFTFPPKDSTLQYKKCVHLWNNFPCISTWAQPNENDLLKLGTSINLALIKLYETNQKFAFHKGIKSLEPDGVNL